MNGWTVIEGHGAQHLVPIGDMRLHWFDACWCSPDDDDGLCVHHALDDREAFETGRRKPS